MAFEDLVVTLLVDEVVGGFFISVPPGHIACVHDLGRGVLPKVLKPGLHFKIPFWQTAKLFNAQTLEYTISDDFDLSHPEALGDKPIIVSTSGGTDIKVKGSLLFHINKQEAPTVWENIGDNFVPKVVRPFTRNQISNVFSQITIDQLGAYRHQIEQKIQENLTKQLDDKGLVVEKFLLSEVERIKPHQKEEKPIISETVTEKAE
jgi:regulator of protease activity HflC (stomatin/prohibitin superfamily)